MSNETENKEVQEAVVSQDIDQYLEENFPKVEDVPEPVDVIDDEDYGEDDAEPAAENDKAEDALSAAANAKELKNSIDAVILNFLVLYHPELDRATVVYPIYKAIVDAIGGKFPESQYIEIAKLAGRKVDEILVGIDDTLEAISTVKDLDEF